MPTRKRVLVVGAGGQARDTAWLLRALAAAGGGFELVGYLVSDLSRLGPHDSREEVVGDLSWLERHQSEVDALALGIGTPRVRLELAASLSHAFPRLEWPNLIHPSAIWDQD